MALSCFAECAVAGDRAGVAHALSRNMTQQMIAGDGKAKRAESQDHVEEHNEGQGTAKAYGSSSSMTREKMRHYLGRIEEFVAGGNH